MLYGRIRLTEDRAIVNLYYARQHKHRNDAHMDPDFKWIWTHDPSFRMAEVSTHALDRTATCMLGTPKAYPLI